MNVHLGKIPHLVKCTLLWKAEAHPSTKAISVLNNAASRKLDCASVVTLECGKHILTFDSRVKT